VSDKAFEGMLKIVKDKILENNELPSATNEAKQTVCPLGLEVQKIHACPKDFILVMPAFLAPNKSPNKSRVFFKIFTTELDHLLNPGHRFNPPSNRPTPGIIPTRIPTKGLGFAGLAITARHRESLGVVTVPWGRNLENPTKTLFPFSSNLFPKFL
jgi:hypothetical protein